MNRTLCFHLIFGSLLTMGIAVSARADDQPAMKSTQAGPTKSRDAKPRVPFTISKETTYIVEPLDKDGYPDYVEALNRHYSKGVTPENNAAVPCWRAMGPRGLLCPPDRRAEFCKLLGIDPLPEKGDYFVSDDELATRLFHPTWNVQKQAFDPPEYNSFFDVCVQAHRRPWTKQDFPQIAEWLELNEKPLAHFIEACNRPRRFDPLLNGNWPESPDPWNNTPFRYSPGNWDGRASDIFVVPIRILTARAMLRLGDGRTDDAWQDLLACHRWARHSEAAPSLGEYRGACAIEEITWHADQAMLQHTRLTGPQIRKMMADLDRLPTIPDVVEKVNIGVRCEYLQLIRGMSQNYLPWTMNAIGLKRLYDFWPVDPGIFADWDVLFRKGNAAVDRVVDIIQHGTLAQRRALRREMGDRANEGKKDAKKDTVPGTILNLFNGQLAANRKRISADLGDSLCDWIIGPSCDARDCEDRLRMRFELTKLAFALAAYRADHNVFPAKLADLVPNYASRIPKDLFSEADLHYSLQDGGYVLYSIGPNREDDGGRGLDDRKEVNEYKPWDDIVVRITAPK